MATSCKVVGHPSRDLISPISPSSPITKKPRTSLLGAESMLLTVLISALFVFLAFLALLLFGNLAFGSASITPSLPAEWEIR